MNNKQRRVFETIFKDPIQPNIEWSEIESLLVALGAELKEGSGSRVRFSLNSVRVSLHRPHPETIAGRGRVRDVRTFLENAEVIDA